MNYELHYDMLKVYLTEVSEYFHSSESPLRETLHSLLKLKYVCKTGKFWCYIWVGAYFWLNEGLFFTSRILDFLKVILWAYTVYSIYYIKWSYDASQ